MNKVKVTYGKDPVVTAISLTVIVVQSLIIYLGYIYRWDWISYEFAAMLVIPAFVVLKEGIQAVIKADKLMTQHNTDKEE